MKPNLMKQFGSALLIHLLLFACFSQSYSAEPAPDKEKGTLRHLGIHYANFVKNGPAGPEGLDIELIRLFAESLGMRYELIETSWSTVFADLSEKGDLIANGMTILPYRQKLVTFSRSTFPTGVWLIAKADSEIQPISPSGDIQKDIETVKQEMRDHSVLSMKNTCLDSALYGLDQYGADIRVYWPACSRNCPRSQQYPLRYCQPAATVINAVA